MLLISYLHWVVAFIILFVILEIVIINTSRRANNGERIVFSKRPNIERWAVLFGAPCCESVTLQRIATTTAPRLAQASLTARHLANNPSGTLLQ